MLNNYEIALILSSQITDKEENKIMDDIRKIVEPGGKLIETKDLGKKQLAYMIGKHKEGNYRVITASILSSSVKALREKISSNELIIRYLFIKKEI